MLLPEAEVGEALYACRACHFSWPISVPCQFGPSVITRPPKLLMCAASGGQVDWGGQAGQA